MAHLPKGQGVVPMPPFLAWLSNNIPAVFDNTMSYYEELVSLIKYLQDTVIPALNADSEAITVISNAVEQLQKYVDDYFKNLDVQEEINNKLDQMAEDGTLQEIITAYIQANVAWTFDTVADMKSATNLVAGSYAQTLGYHAKNDGGASLYYISNSGTANEYNVIAVGSLYANLVNNATIRPEQFGAYGDYTHDDSTALQAVFDYAKVVEFSPKTYKCFNLTCDYADKTLILHGNGATLKRPNLSIAPYNYTVTQMRGVKTITFNTSFEFKDITFDNDCFEMWSIEDGNAQSQSASVYINNATTWFTGSVENCHFLNSAGAGILLNNYCKIDIRNCSSTETWVGGLVMVGTSEINVDGWISNSITLPDGFDVEMTASPAAGNFILNMTNIVVDWDFDINIPVGGIGHISNVTMRSFDQDVQRGAFLISHGELYIDNSTLRFGVSDYNTVLHEGGLIQLSNCRLIGSDTSPLFNIITSGTITNGNLNLKIHDCIIKASNCISIGTLNAFIDIDGCDITTIGDFLIKRGSPNPQPKSLSISNTTINNGGETCIFLAKTSYASWSDGVNLYLSNVKFKGNGEFVLYNTPKIHFNDLVMEACYGTTFGSNAAPVFIGNQRTIAVPSATDLTFRGWVEGGDVAIALDTGVKYRYTTGTTWTAIS